MRKQYHFWPTETGDGVDAWDVNRLVKRTRNLAVVRVDLDSIGEVDSNYWFDATTEPPVRRVVAHMGATLDVDATWPIISGSDRRVMDGMHRVCRAMLGDELTIRAVRFDMDPQPDYRNCDPAELPY